MHIMPALKSGRRVVTTINGINHEKFSELTGIPVPFLEDYLIDISHSDIEDDDEKYEAQKASLLEKSSKDSLVVIDEIQDLFPNGRQKLSTEWSKYIASHRHEGLDIILMGQDFRDMHSIWRRRTQRKIVFVKQTAIGRDKHYKWEAWEARTPEKFEKITSGTRPYEQKYFGLYKSHTDGTSHKDVYKDKRATIFSHGGFKWGAVLIPVLLYFSYTTLTGFFSPSVSAAEHAEMPAKPKKLPTNPKKVLPANPSQPPKSAPEQKRERSEPPLDVFDKLASSHTPRLSGLIVSGDRVLARVQILNSSKHLKDEFSLPELQDLGWSYEVRESGLSLTKGDKTYLVRPWPVDSWGRVNQGTLGSLRGANGAAVSTTNRATAPSANVKYVSHQPRPRMQGSTPRSDYTGFHQREDR